MSCNTVGAAISVCGLAWGPSPRQLIVDAISFDVRPGEMLAIVGPNGAGKSSLLRCLFRAHRPLAGSVRLDGEDIWRMAPRAVARKIAAVLQETSADFPFTVRDVVSLGRIPHQAGLTADTAHDASQVDHALEHLNLAGFGRRSFASLSGGEKQRVLVARALVQEPGLLILDEPTNHLDIRHQLEILELVKGLGMTVITSLHDLDLAARYADRVVILAGGRLVADGLPEAALSPPAIRDVFGVEVHAGASASGRSMLDFSLPSVSAN